VIKRLTFARARGGRSDELEPRWVGALAELSSGAPSEARPERVTALTILPKLGPASPRHDLVVVEWFVGDEQVEANAGWASGEGRDRAAAVFDEVEPDPTVIVAEEVVVRGADWLARHWQGSGVAYKHMALARRVPELDPAELSQRWREHAGRLDETRVIPEDVRGSAYVQDHPRRRAEGEWAYDAVNEVWFDDLEGLQRRVEWFGREASEPLEGGLFSASWFLAGREAVVWPGR
jgi:hypothetical protein